MNTFKNIRNLLLYSYCEGIISDDEFLPLYDAYQSKNPDFSYQHYTHFNLEDIDPAECKAEFRVEKQDLRRLADALQLPPAFKCQRRSTFDSMEGLCMVLKRITYPCRYSDMIPRFGRPVSVLSLVTNCMVDYLYETHAHRITEWNGNLLSPHALQDYAEVISGKGAPLDNCFGFVDGTVWPISRPRTGQRVVYNGHKRVHALKFQSMALPNGLIGNIFGPIEGRKHDAGMLADSGLLQNLEQFAFSLGGQPMCIYGDLAYPLRVHLQTPFRQAQQLTPLMREYNTSMSSVRVSVEWLFGDIMNSFKFLSFKKNLKISLSSIGKMYVVSALMRNALTCLYGNQTSLYFGIEPPVLEEYFR